VRIPPSKSFQVNIYTIKYLISKAFGAGGAARSSIKCAALCLALAVKSWANFPLNRAKHINKKEHSSHTLARGDMLIVRFVLAERCYKYIRESIVCVCHKRIFMPRSNSKATFLNPLFCAKACTKPRHEHWHIIVNLITNKSVWEEKLSALRKACETIISLSLGCWGSKRALRQLFSHYYNNHTVLGAHGANSVLNISTIYDNISYFVCLTQSH
jgi:hypothetical protein